MTWRNLSTKMKDSFDVVSFLSKKRRESDSMGKPRVVINPGDRENWYKKESYTYRNV